MPRASNIAAKDAEAIPLPRDETTPPVTKINRVAMKNFLFYVIVEQQTG
ncbi:MAG: hypothetical protein ACJAYG_001834 [Oceanicoccus sp.]|jgi:hypothetical protein